MTKLGRSNMTLQPGWTIDEDEFGLLSGECTWEGDFALRNTLRTGRLHPYDHRLTGYRRRVQRLATDKCRVTISYIGIVSDPTPTFIEHPGGSGQDPIESHPDFADFAGTPETPLNGAKFDDDTGEFIGFTDPDSDLLGTRSYIVPSVMVTATWYSHSVPYMSAVGRVSSFVPYDLRYPSNVRDFLCVGMPYRRIGNLYQCSIQLLGSGPLGWNRRIYG